MPLNAFWFSKEIYENKLKEKRKLTLSFLILKCKIFWCHILTRGGKRLCFGFRAELVQVRMLWGYAIFITKILTLWSGVGYKGPGILNLSGIYRYADKNLLWTPFKRGPLVVTLRLKGWQSLIVWCPWCDVACGEAQATLGQSTQFLRTRVRAGNGAPAPSLSETCSVQQQTHVWRHGPVNRALQVKRIRVTQEHF